MFGPACKYWIFLSACVIVTSSEENLAKYVENMQQCAQEHMLKPEDIERLRNHELPNVDRTITCFLACAFKSNDMMNENGMIELEKINKITHLFLSDTPDQMKLAIEYTDACGYVNNEPVTDGYAGCDRAALMFKCMVEHSDKQRYTREINEDEPRYDF